MEPVRSILRHKKATVKYYEADATKIDHEKKVVYINDDSDIKGETSSTEVPFDMLVVGVGAENATFGIQGVKENSCFLKEVGDAQKIRKRIMDCVETASFKDQSPEERKRLLHMVVVGGGPTGVEFAGELQDFFEEDLRKWVPEITDNFHVHARRSHGQSSSHVLRNNSSTTPRKPSRRRVSRSALILRSRR